MCTLQVFMQIYISINMSKKCNLSRNLFRPLNFITSAIPNLGISHAFAYYVYFLHFYIFMNKYPRPACEPFRSHVD